MYYYDTFCTPSSGVAEAISTNWTLEGIPGRINGDVWVACDECRPTSFWHAECVGKYKLILEKLLGNDCVWLFVTDGLKYLSST